jgi:hypothetical protein
MKQISAAAAAVPQRDIQPPLGGSSAKSSSRNEKIREIVIREQKSARAIACCYCDCAVYALCQANGDAVPYCTMIFVPAAAVL